MQLDQAKDKLTQTLESYLNNPLYDKFTGNITFSLNCNQGGISTITVETKSSIR